MLGLLSIIALGFFLGMRHATDPDHVIAVSTIVSRHRSLVHAGAIGLLWGIGHTLTILLVGGGIVLFGWVIPARIGLSMELSVGLMLILLGVLNLTGFLQWLARVLPHRHWHDALCEPPEHAHAPPQGSDPGDPAEKPLHWFDRHFGGLSLYHAVRPLAVGLVHGLAGSAAVALLVLATIRNPKWAMAYLLVFGIGTIAGMMLITGALAIPFALSRGRLARLSTGMRLVSGLVSVGFGLFLVYEIGFVNGLLAGHPQWTPQ